MFPNLGANLGRCTYSSLGDASYSDIFANIFGAGGSSTGTGTATNDEGGGSDIVTTTTSGARVRSSAELSARLAASGGALDVEANSSDYIVAANNPLRFSTVRLADGRYRITGNMNLYLLGGGAALLLVLMLAAK